ncbi:MAG: methyl-accepting chemotaxis protein [Deltaproteobacteria bacterium]
MENRRSFINFSIKRHLQMRLLGMIMLAVVISALINAASFYFFSNHEIGNSLMQFHVKAKSFLDLLFPFIIVSLVVGIIVALGITIFIPHKIAGPLYRIERDIKDKLGEGNFAVKFSVRGKNELGDLAEALNAMEAKLRVKFDRMQRTSAELVQSAEALSGEGDAARRVKNLARSVDEAAREFKI